MRSRPVYLLHISFARPGTRGLLLAILACVFGCVFLGSTTAQAQLPLGSAGADSRCVTPSDLNEYRGIVHGRYPCKAKSDPFAGGNTSVFARGSSRATFGFQTGFARVQGSALAVFSGVGIPSNASASVFLDAIVVYSLDLPLVGIPPPGYVGQPLPLTITGTVSGQDMGNTSYGATITISGPGEPYAWEANSFGMENQSILAPVKFDVGTQYLVTLHASCTAIASALPGADRDSSCAATADPTFEFDQAAWDALLGEDSFPLADYFSIAFSENLVATPLAVDIAKFVNDTRREGPNDSGVPRVAPGETMSWVYEVANLGDNAIPAADLIVTDSDPSLTPMLDPSSDDGDMILSPFEVWEYTASAPALNLSVPLAGVTVVPGCLDDRNTYQNTGRVEIAGTEIFDEDVSYYCNDQIYPVPTPMFSRQMLVVLALILAASGTLLHGIRDRQAG